MMKTLCVARVVAYPEAHGFALAMGARPLSAWSAQLSADRGMFAPERLTHVFAPDARLRRTRKQNNSTTHIAAAGGASGPQPEWDPV